jgi:hypothetical protein
MNKLIYVFVLLALLGLTACPNAKHDDSQDGVNYFRNDSVNKGNKY